MMLHQNFKQINIKNFSVSGKFQKRSNSETRPHFCWRFLGFLSQTQRANEAKKRGRGRGPEASHRLLFFHRKRKSQ